MVFTSPDRNKFKTIPLKMGLNECYCSFIGRLAELDQIPPSGHNKSSAQGENKPNYSSKSCSPSNRNTHFSNESRSQSSSGISSCRNFHLYRSDPIPNSMITKYLLNPFERSYATTLNEINAHENWVSDLVNFRKQYWNECHYGGRLRGISNEKL